MSITSFLPKTRVLTSSLGAVALLATGGCYVRAHTRPPTARAHMSGSVSTNATTTAEVTPPPSPPPAQASVTITAGTPSVATGVTVVDRSCVQGSQEACNGLDDNCNGVIDEGCGFQTGNIQVTLAWANDADLDLYVTDPTGAQIFYNNREVASGGHLDQDARGGCTRTQADSNLENIYWDQANPPTGNYQVAVHYWDGNRCSTAAGPTSLTMSIAVGGRIIGAYNYTISPGERVNLAAFQL